jgi:hypothetical protein
VVLAAAATASVSSLVVSAAAAAAAARGVLRLRGVGRVAASAAAAGGILRLAVLWLTAMRLAVLAVRRWHGRRRAVLRLAVGLGLAALRGRGRVALAVWWLVLRLPGRGAVRRRVLRMRRGLVLAWRLVRGRAAVVGRGRAGLRGLLVRGRWCRRAVAARLSAVGVPKVVLALSCC